MVRHLIQLPDGTEISSGSNATINIRSCKVTDCCNDRNDLSFGSVCSSCCELSLQALDNTLRNGDAFTLYQIDDGSEKKLGIFNVKEYKRVGKQLYKCVAYDNISRLDVDLTDWLKKNIASLAYSEDIRVFPAAVCDKCGLVFSASGFNAQTSLIRYFEPSGAVTGRKLLQWVSEMYGFFCIADVDGRICFSWYKETDAVLNSTGELYRIQGTFKHNNPILPTDGVRISHEAGVTQYPYGYSLQNPYRITDNEMLAANSSSTILQVAEQLHSRLQDLWIKYSAVDHYAACEVAVPISSGINIGDIITVDEQDALQGEAHPPRTGMLVMSKVSTGQRCILKCTGSYRRTN